MTAYFKILVTETIISYMNIVVCEINCALKKIVQLFEIYTLRIRSSVFEASRNGLVSSH